MGSVSFGRVDKILSDFEDLHKLNTTSTTLYTYPVLISYPVDKKLYGWDFVAATAPKHTKHVHTT